MQRQSLAVPQPNTTCNDSTEGLVDYNPDSPKNIWICKSSKWLPYTYVIAM